MPKRLLARCRPDCIDEFRQAAESRFNDGLQLAAQGRRLGAIYLWGYGAEMAVKAAYFSFVGLGRHAHNNGRPCLAGDPYGSKPRYCVAQRRQLGMMSALGRSCLSGKRHSTTARIYGTTRRRYPNTRGANWPNSGMKPCGIIGISHTRSRRTRYAGRPNGCWPACFCFEVKKCQSKSAGSRSPAAEFGPLYKQLAEELKSESQFGQPTVYQEEYPTGKIRVVVTWDQFDGIPMEERTGIILRAYSEAFG